MSRDDQLSLLIDDLDEAETVEHVQTNVLLLNQALEERESDPELSSLVGGEDHLDTISTWLDRVDKKMEELSTESNISNYSISVGGSLVGPNVSISVTVSLD